MPYLTHSAPSSPQHRRPLATPSNVPQSFASNSPLGISSKTSPRRPRQPDQHRPTVISGTSTLVSSSSSSTRRTPAASARRNSRQLRSPSTSITFQRAIDCELPTSPPTDHIHNSPPSTFPSRLQASIELLPTTPQGHTRTSSDSPFDDRLSIALNEVQSSANDRDSFLSGQTGSPGRRKTMPGYQCAALSPSSRDRSAQVLTFDPRLEDLRPVSEARRSLYSESCIPSTTLEQHSDLVSSSDSPIEPRRSSPDPIRPTFRGLFALSQPRDLLVHLLPAFACSVAAALVQPYMSIVIGEAFAVFVKYPSDTTLITAADNAALLSGVRETTIKLTAVGAFAVVLNYAKGVLWMRHGEVVADRLRKTMYEGVQNKGMDWFDLGMGMREEEVEDGEAVGAGGLMAKFTRETDDFRLGMSQALGLAIQNFFTFLFCFILALVKSPILALVTLSTIPLVVLVQIATQIVCVPLYAQERRAIAEASTNVERATLAIATVKVHNAQQSEVERFQPLVSRACASITRQAVVWAFSISISDFFLLATFVLGFWYGARMVRDGKITPGDVMTVFWACLLAASFLQMVVPQLIIVTKAKNSMASLRTVIREDPTANSKLYSASSSTTASTPHSSWRRDKSRPLSLKGISPPKCRGEFNLRNISFAYPSRPENLVLRDVTVFIPPGETTFIVGGSGSGKSTIAQLLLRLYVPDRGEITLDDQSFPYLDINFCREHIAAVQQGCILVDMSVHDNVAMGLAGTGPHPQTGVARRPSDVTRKEVVEACKMATIHDFIENLPNGYETSLGTGGSSLSGGQRQRLVIARARIRDPTVLILDEATSALDATSRVLVFESIKAWRRNRTTIVITHDLSQIVADDFVYVMKNGIVAEQGFRSDLIKRMPMRGQSTGIFAALAAEQVVEPLPLKVEEWQDRPENEEILGGEEEMEAAVKLEIDRKVRPHTPLFGVGARPGSVMYLDILDEYARGARLSALEGDRRGVQRLSTAQKRLGRTADQLDSRKTSRTSLTQGYTGSVYGGSRRSLVVPSRSHNRLETTSQMPVPRVSLELTQAGQLTPGMGEMGGRVMSTMQFRNQTMSHSLQDELKGDLEIISHLSPYDVEPAKPRGVVKLIIHYFPTLVQKYLLFLGLLGAVGHGVSTPVWSFFLSKLMSIVGSGGTDPNLTRFGLVVLALSGAQAVADWVQEYCLTSLGAKWTAQIRQTAFGKVLKQDKGWFDESANSPARLVQSLIKDADDMRQLMGTMIGKFVVFVAMVGLGVVWALVIDWRLTLVGFAIVPVFAFLMILNTCMIGQAESINKAKREAVARSFYESISNIREIRAMALDGTFRDQFVTDAAHARKTGKRVAWVVAIGLAATAGVPLFAQGLLNWAGCQFMIKGYLNYAQMLQVFNLVLFSLTFGSAMLDFIPTMQKAKMAARDFDRLFTLSESTAESTGELRYPISGQVTFSQVGFAYPTRSDVPILSNLSLTLTPGECVAVVGPSGCGKSTVAALLQRLYEPTSGSIWMDKYDLSRADTKWLRNHIAVVSQGANLFDATVSQNIACGSELSIGEIHRAAKAANIHHFIQSLPDGYDTNLGENASLISGGQAQRLQIARALVRRSSILILDECTSALDVDNQRAILDTIIKIKDNRITVFITHSVEAMRRCDRVICLGDGRVAEEGTFDELVMKGGVFAQHMKTGEWE